MDLEYYLQQMIEKDASDMYLTTGALPYLKIYDRLTPLSQQRLTPNTVKILAYAIMSKTQIQEFEQQLEMNLALGLKDIGRFRVNIFMQRNQVSMVIRNIKTNIPDPDALELPAQLKHIVMEKRGLILFVGATGSGKSTTLAALIGHRNANNADHIITIEDPIEYVHTHKKSIVNQREVGVDTDSYEDALKNTLRQAPDVILIGEIRDKVTMQHAVAFAETGHLCLSTLHANNANQALERIINFFPKARRQQIMLDLALNLRGIISQRLIPTMDGKRALAVEILLGTPLIKDLIQRGEIYGIKEVMAKSHHLGMQTFDMAIYDLFVAGKISAEHALNSADSKNNLRLRINQYLEQQGKETIQATPTAPDECEETTQTWVTERQQMTLQPKDLQ